MAPFITTLAQTHNLRILGFDLYGRGYSASPGVPYSTSLYVSQLKELLDGVGWMSSSVSSSDNEMTAKVNVLGFSMGGGIAVAFVEKYGKWVEKVVLMAPSGLIEVRKYRNRKKKEICSNFVFSFTDSERSSRCPSSQDSNHW